MPQGHPCPSLIIHAGKDVVTARAIPFDRTGIPAHGPFVDMWRTCGGQGAEDRFANTLFEWLGAN